MHRDLRRRPDTIITACWRLIDPDSPIAERLRVDAQWLRVKRETEAGDRGA